MKLYKNDRKRQRKLAEAHQHTSLSCFTVLFQQRLRRFFFFLGRHNWEYMCNIGATALMMSAEAWVRETRGHPGVCSPEKFWKFKYSSRMQSGAIWTLKFSRHQDFVVVKKERYTWWPFPAYIYIFSVCFNYHSIHGLRKFLIDIEFSKAILPVIWCWTNWLEKLNFKCVH